MSSNSNLAYALAAMTALALGLGVSFWRSSAENKSLLRANLTAGIALEAAQDEVKVLREKLTHEIKAREYAEAAQTVAETAERGTRERLIQETKARQGAEAARLEAEAKLKAAALKLAQETDARIRAGAALEAANADLAQEREARAAAELRRDEAVETVAELTVKLNQENAASNAIREALAAAEGRGRVLSTRLAREMEAREKAVTMRMQAISAAAASEGLQATDKSKDEASNGGPAHSARPAPFIQANDLSRRNLVVQ